MRKLLLLVVCLPADVLGALIALPVFLFASDFDVWASRGMLVFTLRRDSWFYREVYSGWTATTFGHVVMRAPTATEDTLRHEGFHVEQFEADCVLAGVLAGVCVLAGVPWLGLALWAVTPMLATFSAFGQAAVKYGMPYWMSHRERAARWAERFGKGGWS